ncbi:phage tail protein [Chloroflexota bacterium]
MKIKLSVLIAITSISLLGILLFPYFSKASAPTNELPVGHLFKFEIDGKEIQLISCEPGAMTAELKDASKGTRQNNNKNYTVPKPKFGTWRIEKYYSQGDLRLKTLFDSFATGQRKTNPSDAGSLTYQNRDGSVARKVNFYGFTPLKYESINLEARSGTVSVKESMVFSVTRVEYVNGDSNGDGDQTEENTFSLTSDPNIPIEPVYKFTLDLIQGGQEGTSNWWGVTGGEQTLDPIDYTTGNDPDERKNPGLVKYSEVEITGSLCGGKSREDLLDWLNDWANGQQDMLEDATLKILDDNEKVLRTVNFLECFPIAYHPPSVRSGEPESLMETIVFRPVRVEDKPD